MVVVASILTSPSKVRAVRGIVRSVRSGALVLTLADFRDTAALVELMDLVVSVDTAAAHLAGAMAKPVWVLLPWSPDWRWLLERTDSPWYPTARLCRQERPGDWPGVIARLARELPAA